MCIRDRCDTTHFTNFVIVKTIGQFNQMKHKNNSLSVGCIIGIAVGCSAFIIIISLGIFYYFCHKKRNEKGCQNNCLLYTSPSPRDKRQSRMPSSA
eukprot:TRINITY_DN2250_c0_g1_i3.p1 TRINITY_DN2250_c0_g1~~TRINITY_DN2250_c0_g1_i3.p1  ORF type:complete len:107 (+),score=53.61 TRINITY_DN2250_c0_g1_i3:34-321(+)